jgi:hypothetical protein
MPTDSILLSIAVCGVFLLFAVTVAWIDHRTTRWQRSRISGKHTGPTAEPPRKEAA